jgi:hypothetical protein
MRLRGAPPVMLAPRANHRGLPPLEPASLPLWLHLDQARRCRIQVCTQLPP